MPYQGIKCKSEDFLITVKAFEEISRSNLPLLEYIRNTVLNLEPIEHPNIFAQNISEALRGELFQSYEVPWFEVEVMSKDGSLFGITTLDENEYIE